MKQLPTPSAAAAAAAAAAAFLLLLSNASLEAEGFAAALTLPSSPRLAVGSSLSSRSRSRRSSGANVGAAAAQRAQAAAIAVAAAPVDEYDLLPPEEEEEDVVVENDDGEAEASAAAADLKRELYQLAASYDRGFGATPRVRDEADDIVRRLAAMNPTTDAARGIDGGGGDDDDEVPLKAVWRMIWTSAFDVVSLGASPFAAPSAIYQDITQPPIATNVIDFIPRAQTLFPSSISPPSLLRAEVTTSASSRTGKPNRVGLTFDALTLRPIEFLGQKVDNLPPLSVDLTWPRNLVERLVELVPGLDMDGLGGSGGGGDNADAPGYFDVEYLDDELLIIRQQVPGGVFALVKVDSCEP